MEVNILECNINVQEIYDKVSKSGSGTVSLFVGNQKDVFVTSVLGTVTGDSRNRVINTFLTKVCTIVRKKYDIENIAVNCWLDAPVNEPCLAIACLALNYNQACEAVNAAVDLINGSKLKATEDETIIDIVSAELIQVKASCDEIKQRIQSFIDRRREQLNVDNIRDFCCIKSPSQEYSCARVDAVKIHRKDSSSHLRVRKVCNTWGPQTNQAMFEETENNLCNNVMVECSTLIAENTKSNAQNIFSVSKTERELLINERIKNIEQHIGLETNYNSSDVYARLKRIEDKILYLEGLSPEYFDCCPENPLNSTTVHRKNLVKKSYTLEDLSKKIRELECKAQRARE